MSDSSQNESSIGGEPVAAACQYRASAGDGDGVIVEISQRAARVEKASLGMQPGEKLKLQFRFFETSTPVEIPSQVPEGAAGEQTFTASFQAMDAVLSNMLRMMMGKLRKRTSQSHCKTALLHDVC